MTWFGAAAYCNWLSEREGLPKDQWCYLPNDRGEYGDGMKVPADALRRTGYRLPTEAEWEYACRAGTLTSRYYGDTTTILGNYAWYLLSSGDPETPHPCGRLLPNDLGLFDMLGNLDEWCHDRPGESSVDLNTASVLSSHARSIRGGSYRALRPAVRSADRRFAAPSYRFVSNGFRPARTLRSSLPAASP